MTNTMAVESIPESTLVERAQSGDADAYSQLVKAYEPRMLRTALRVVRDMDDAQDATQQAFTSAWVNLNKFRGDAQFSTWITRITINESLGVLRRRKNVHVELREGLIDGEEAHETPAASADSPESSLLKREVVHIVRQSLRLVKPIYREAMKLRVLEDLSVEEISGRLNIPANTVKVHLFRARQAMKGFLTERLGYAAA